MTADKRIERVSELILDAYTRPKIIKYAKEHYWNVMPSTIDRYIKEARKRISKACNESIEVKATKALNRLERQFYKADQEGNRKTALAIQKEINRINALYKVNETTIQLIMNNPQFNFIFETIWNELAEYDRRNKELNPTHESAFEVIETKIKQIAQGEKNGN